MSACTCMPAHHIACVHSVFFARFRSCRSTTRWESSPKPSHSFNTTSCSSSLSCSSSSRWISFLDIHRCLGMCTLTRAHAQAFQRDDPSPSTTLHLITLTDTLQSFSRSVKGERRRAFGLFAPSSGRRHRDFEVIEVVAEDGARELVTLPHLLPPHSTRNHGLARREHANEDFPRV